MNVESHNHQHTFTFTIFFWWQSGIVEINPGPAVGTEGPGPLTAVVHGGGESNEKKIDKISWGR